MFLFIANAFSIKTLPRLIFETKGKRGKGGREREGLYYDDTIDVRTYVRGRIKVPDQDHFVGCLATPIVPTMRCVVFDAIMLASIVRIHQICSDKVLILHCSGVADGKGTVLKISFNQRSPDASEHTRQYISLCFLLLFSLSEIRCCCSTTYLISW